MFIIIIDTFCIFSACETALGLLLEHNNENPSENPVLVEGQQNQLNRRRFLCSKSLGPKI